MMNNNRIIHDPLLPTVKYMRKESLNYNRNWWSNTMMGVDCFMVFPPCCHRVAVFANLVCSFQMLIRNHKILHSPLLNIYIYSGYSLMDDFILRKNFKKITEAFKVVNTLSDSVPEILMACLITTSVLNWKGTALIINSSAKMLHIFNTWIVNVLSSNLFLMLVIKWY